MLSAEYSKAFLQIDQISKVQELAVKGIYTPDVLIEDSIKHLLKDRITVENSLGLLIDSNLVRIDSSGMCIAESIIPEKLNHKIINNLIDRGVVGRIAKTFSQASQEGIRNIDTFKLFPKYRGVLSLATSLNIVRHDIDRNTFFITKDDEELFKDFLEDDNLTKYENGMSLEKLQQQLSAQNLRGEAAEEFVLENERIRLKGHPKLDSIKRVSLTNVSAGFDIQSFESLNSTEIDKFIEVKSYIGTPGFYWSINEIDFAKEKGFKYCLIIINSENIIDGDYVIHEIRNPYEIFKIDRHIKKKESDPFEITTTNFYICTKEK